MLVDISPKGHRNHLLFGLGEKRNTISFNLSIHPHARRHNEEYIPLMKISSSQGKPVAIGKPAIGTVAVKFRANIQLMAAVSCLQHLMNKEYFTQSGFFLDMKHVSLAFKSSF